MLECPIEISSIVSEGYQDNCLYAQGSTNHQRNPSTVWNFLEGGAPEKAIKEPERHEVRKAEPYRQPLHAVYLYRNERRSHDHDGSDSEPKNRNELTNENMID